jgi:streptomycin 6-kinase
MIGEGTSTLFEEYLLRWQLVPDGEPIITRTSQLLPVRQHHTPAMLKLALSEEEACGNALMSWWQGHGAAQVLAQHGHAILMERAMGPDSLTAYARNGRDDEASCIICATVARLHESRHKPLPDLVPLQSWFGELRPVAARHGGILALASATAETLLAEPKDITVLHGDIHHGNVLNFGVRGWLAVDPKGLLGERSFDYVNLFCNPDYDIASKRAVFRRRIEIVSHSADLDPTRLLQWILAWAGLSAAWNVADNLSSETAFAVAELAAAEPS